MPEEFELRRTRQDDRFETYSNSNVDDHGQNVESRDAECRKGINCRIPIYDEHHNDENEAEDYSIIGYFKFFECYKIFDEKLKRFAKRVNLKRKLWKLFCSILVLLYVLFFIVVLLYSSTEKKNDYDYWCNGEGYFIIITTSFFAGLFYFKIIKPIVFKIISRQITKFISKSPEIQRRHLKWKEFLDTWYIKLLKYSIIFVAITLLLFFDTEGDRVRLISALGIVIILFLGFIFSAAPRKIIWSQVMWGIVLQFCMGFITLRWSVGRGIFECLGSKISLLLSFSDPGTIYLFGEEMVSEWGIFIIKLGPVIFFFNFLIQILYYYGVMQCFIIKFGWLLQTSIGTTPCESISASANMFMDGVSSALLVGPYLADLTKSELHVIMTGAMATIAGGVLAAFISFGISATHLITASAMSAPAALSLSKLFYPEVEKTKTNLKNIELVKGGEGSVLHAGIEGVRKSIPMMSNLAAVLIAFISFIAFLDAIFNWFCLRVDLEDGVCTLSNLAGYVFTPLAWVMGVPWVDCHIVGQLIGTKTVINEFVAYIQLKKYIDDDLLQNRSQVIATYALCGFSNVGTIGIILGSLGAVVPTRRDDLARIAFRSLIAASFACFLTACVAGTLLPSDAISFYQNSTVNATS